MLPTLTVFTPTYNRAHTLRRTFESLCNQTSGDFRWLVLDDGSTDGTKELIDSVCASAGFPIEYVYQENRGKHEAINAGVERTHTELFLILDSDDELLPDAVELIIEHWRSIPGPQRARYAGIWGLCATTSGDTLTGPLAKDVLDTTLQELRYVYKIDQDLLRCFVTEVLRRFPFPATACPCPYIPEGYVWFRMTRDHVMRFLNVPCSRIYPQPDGLIANARHEYPLSHCVIYVYVQPLDSDLEWFWDEPSHFVLSAIQAARYSLFSGQFGRIMGTLCLKGRALLLAGVPIALLLLAKDWASGRIAAQMRSAHMCRNGRAR
jgi:glycosyltransferase involved in cell wall biosynthesis